MYHTNEYAFYILVCILQIYYKINLIYLWSSKNTKQNNFKMPSKSEKVAKEAEKAAKAEIRKTYQTKKDSNRKAKEAVRKAEEEAISQAEKEAAHKAAEEEAIRKAEEEAIRKAEEEAIRKAAKEEAAHKATFKVAEEKAHLTLVRKAAEEEAISEVDLINVLCGHPYHTPFSFFEDDVTQSPVIFDCTIRTPFAFSPTVDDLSSARDFLRTEW